MVARRRFLGWMVLTPAGFLLPRCAGEGGDALDALLPDGGGGVDGVDGVGEVDGVGVVDVLDGADVSAEVGLEIDAAPRVCVPTRPDALGPFYRAGAPARVDLAGTEPGEPMGLEGQVLDADCRPIPGAQVEVWQADREGDYHDDRLRATLIADAEGRYAFTSIMPGRYLQASGLRPAHIHFRVSASGFSTVVTQVYFAGDPYLAPNDSCRTCGSNDPDRIVAMSLHDGRLEGVCDVILAAA